MTFPYNTKLTLRQADALLALARDVVAAHDAQARERAVTLYKRTAVALGLTMTEAESFAMRHMDQWINAGEAA